VNAQQERKSQKVSSLLLEMIRKGDYAMATKKRMGGVLLILGFALLSMLLGTLQLASSALAKTTPLPRTWQAVAGIQSANQEIQGMAFLPGALWVNVGDTVVWTAKNNYVHTVTFLRPGQKPPPFNLFDPLQGMPQGSHTYDGVSYYNSGFMNALGILPGGKGYSLTFAVAGDFTYYCLFHSSMMTGIVHVRAAGTSYRYSQADYNHQIEQSTASLMHDGMKLADWAEDHESKQQVILGVGDGKVSVMRFFPQSVTTHVGQTVTFTNHDPMESHTVTFGADQPQSVYAPYGNPKAFDGSAPLNSGYLGTNAAWFGKSFSVTFLKAGTYAFRCDLHDQMGMLLNVVVLP